jgi:hypothetical protein
MAHGEGVCFVGFERFWGLTCDFAEVFEGIIFRDVAGA